MDLVDVANLVAVAMLAGAAILAAGVILGRHLHRKDVERQDDKP